jgi:hypothetical protein
MRPDLPAPSQGECSQAAFGRTYGWPRPSRCCSQT